MAAWDKDPIVSGNAWDNDPVVESAPPKENSIIDEAKRQGGLGIRALLSAAASPVALGGDMVGKALNAGNALLGGDPHYFKPYTGAVQQGLDAAGLPKPERPIERFTQGMAETSPAFALPATLPAQVGGNAVIAAAQAKPGDELGDAAWGAGGGAVGQGLTRTMKGLVKPTAAAQELMDQGIALTPGQAAGKGSAFGKIEELASSNPVTGLAVQPARRRAVEEFNLTAVNQVIKDITGSPVPKGTAPREAVEQAADLISKQYDSALEGISASAGDVVSRVQHSLSFAISENPMMLPKDAKHLSRYVNERLPNMPQTLTGQQLKHVDTEIGEQARRMSQSALASDRAAAPAWYELQAGLRLAMEDGAVGDAAIQLNKANAAFRHLLPVRKALAGNDIMTPRRLRQTIEAMEQQGNHPSIGFAKAAEATLPGTIPNSGTAERLMANALPALLLGGGYGTQQFGLDTLGAGMMGAGALGTRTGSRFMTGSLPKQQEAAMLVDILRRGVPALTRKPQNDEQP